MLEPKRKNRKLAKLNRLAKKKRQAMAAEMGMEKFRALAGEIVGIDPNDDDELPEGIGELFRMFERRDPKFVEKWTERLAREYVLGLTEKFLEDLVLAGESIVNERDGELIYIRPDKATSEQKLAHDAIIARRLGITKGE